MKRFLVNALLVSAIFVGFFGLGLLAFQALDRETENRVRYNIHYQDVQDCADPHRYERAPGDEPNPDAWKLIKPVEGDWE